MNRLLFSLKTCQKSGTKFLKIFSPMKIMRGTGFLFLPKTNTFVFWHIAEISARYCRQNDRTGVAHLFCFQEIIKNQDGSGFFVQKIWNLVWNGTTFLKIVFTHIFWTKFLKIFFTHVFSARNRLNLLLIHPVMDTKNMIWPKSHSGYCFRLPLAWNLFEPAISGHSGQVCLPLCKMWRLE